MTKIRSSFQIIVNSPWAFLISIIFIDNFISIISIIYNIISAEKIMKWSMITLIITFIYWIIDLYNEGLYKGENTKKECENLIIGFIIFVISEITIFIILFSSYFYNSFIPSIDLGCEWPPIGINIINTYALPLFNTALLYFSGIAMSICQNRIINKKNYSYFIIMAIFFALLFTTVQVIEYKNSYFSIYDSSFASSFFVLTGFHGIHVIIGVSIIIIIAVRTILLDFPADQISIVGFNIGIIYWAFVDYAWLFILIIVYIWGS